MKNVILIHGIGGYKKESYFGYLKDECEKLGLKVFVPQMPGWRDGGTYEKWVEIFEKECGAINEYTLVLGQSLGTQFAVKYFAEKNKEILAYISCAGMSSMAKLRPTPENAERGKDFEKIIPSFAISKEEYEKFYSLRFPKFSFYSDNDNFFEQSNLEKYVADIGSTPTIVKGKGHFSIGAGVFKFPEVMELIKNLYFKVD
ncbi:MAG: alpha/beta hydrolase [Clostridiales bacterium]|jgi:predicted alpha/beta hydrolase family esterase|nr:alpha/beta hydrolase [Clostridiales bacterium]